MQRTFTTTEEADLSTAFPVGNGVFVEVYDYVAEFQHEDAASTPVKLYAVGDNLYLVVRKGENELGHVFTSLKLAVIFAETVIMGDY